MTSALGVGPLAPAGWAHAQIMFSRPIVNFDVAGWGHSDQSGTRTSDRCPDQVNNCAPLENMVL
jgi:hypothetical protein